MIINERPLPIDSKTKKSSNIIIYYKIIWIVRGFWFVNKCYEAWKWHEQCGLTVSEMWEFTLHASYIIFLFVNTENNNFIKEIKHVVRASIACWKPWQILWEFLSRLKPKMQSRVFTDLLSNPPKHLPLFSPCYEGTEKMFYFLNNGTK